MIPCTKFALKTTLLIAPLLFSLTSLVGKPTRWTDSGTTFSQGQLGESGQNLYLNRRGEIEVIRRYDLDGNGHLDLLFNSTHDIYNALPATLATLQNQQVSLQKLEVDGSSRVIAHDLNRDGYVDLVFMPNRQNVQQQRSSLAIAWGSAAGWNTERLTRQLPVNGVTRFGVGDFNHDGWPDLITLNSDGWLFGQPTGRIIRTYWGSKDGFMLNRMHDLGIPGAVDLATGTFGSDGAASVVVLAEDGTLHWLSHSGNDLQLQTISKTQLPLKSVAGQTPRPQAIAVQSGKNPQTNLLWVSTDTTALYSVSSATLNGAIKEVSARPATHLTVGDLDGDSWPDLVLTQLNLVYPTATSQQPAPASVTVYWGSAQGPKTETPLSLSIPNAQSTAIGDMNGDGRPDLAVAVYQGKESLQAQSLLLLNPGGRNFTTNGLTVPTEGAEGVTITALQPNAQPTAIFTHSQHRTLDDAVPLRLYWGVKGGFSRDTFVDIPNLSGYKSSAADLNSDGHVDMIVINGGDISEEASARAPDTGINIYWGGKTGDMKGPGPTQFAFARRDVLPEKHLGSINVADLNRDGYLDLILGAFESASRPDTELIIYYGTPTGYNAEHRVAIPVSGRSIGCLIADFNRDGELDIVVGSYTKNEVVVFWGKDGAHRADNKTIIPYPAPIDLEAADFNGDGWLDLIVASYQDSVSQNHDTGSSIFWGGKEGWHQSRSQWLPGMTPLGLAVADLDGDGFLDLVSPHYHGELSREHLPSYIFWGSAAGFGAQRRTSLTVNSASEAVIADFDGDGRLDLAFAAHSVDPGHLLESPIFYNDGKRFENPKVQYLPAIGPHYMWVQDIGNIAHRRNEEHFDSRVFSWNERLRAGRIEVDAQTPFKSRVALQIRTAAQAGALSQASWQDVPRSSFNLQAEDRFLQYRLLLQSANGDAYPIVRKVEVSVK